MLQDRNSSRAGRRSTLTLVLLLLEAAVVVVSQSLSCVPWVLATIHSFTVVTLGHVKIAVKIVSLCPLCVIAWSRPPGRQHSPPPS